ncbi:MAG: hypothetical protein GX975_03805 [Clostridiales bacterium]|nr:hypothetical protein [Clostridiales bacterium]
MKNELIFKAIGEVDDRYILEAAPAVTRKTQKQTWVKWIAIAACLALFVYAGSKLLPSRDIVQPDIPPIGDITKADNPPEEVAMHPSGLPMLTIAADSGGYGFEGFSAYDISQLENDNPWTVDSQLESLPVFRNTTQSDSAGIPIHGLSADEMLARAKDAADTLGLVIDKSYVTEETAYINPNEQITVPGAAIVECGDIEIFVWPDGWLRIMMKESLSLPEQYKFNDDLSDEQATETLEYLIAEYAGIVDMKSPALAISARYGRDGGRSLTYKVYEGSGDLTEKILGYNFNYTIFCPDFDDNLHIIHRYNYDLSEKVGDYPIISAQQAKELLLNGNYITSVPYEIPGPEYVKKIELVYRVTSFEEVYMPYYLFYIELPETELENGIKSYGFYYVPAIHSDYISNMPVWDGSFQ